MNKIPQLILVRHGQSIWNLENRFTGWIDVPLSDSGYKETEILIKAFQGWPVYSVYCSNLIRSLQTALIILQAYRDKSPVVVHDDPRHHISDGDHILPVYKAWQLNERHYGIYQGQNKATVKQQLGENRYNQVRRGFDIRPENGESLSDTLERVVPFFYDVIHPNIEKGKNILIVAHGNSIRALIKNLCGLSDKEVMSYEVPTAHPLKLYYDNHQYELVT